MMTAGADLQVHREAGRFEDSFLDLQRLSRIAPGQAGMLAALQHAANLCLGATRGTTSREVPSQRPLCASFLS
jgi:hypothetical protein